MPIIRSVHKASLAVCTAELAHLQVRIISKLEYTMLSSDFSKLFRTSVKPVHRYHLCTGLVILVDLKMTYISEKT